MYFLHKLTLLVNNLNSQRIKNNCFTQPVAYRSELKFPFDKIEHEVLLQMMENKDFLNK
jgi:hypothetical protein